MEGRAISVRGIMDAYDALRRHREWLIVEGAGGLAVPIAGKYLMRDLAREGPAVDAC